MTWIILPTLTSVITFATYTMTGGKLDADKAFTSIVLFNLLRFPLAMLPRCVSMIVELNIALGRINRCLEADELPETKIKDRRVQNILLGMRNANMFWDDDMKKP